MGYGEELAPLAQDGQWDVIEDKLSTRMDDLQAQYDTLQGDKEGNAQRLAELEDQMLKIQIHLNGIRSKSEYESMKSKEGKTGQQSASSAESTLHQRVAEQEKFNQSRSSTRPIHRSSAQVMSY